MKPHDHESQGNIVFCMVDFVGVHVKIFSLGTNSTGVTNVPVHLQYDLEFDFEGQGHIFDDVGLLIKIILVCTAEVLKPKLRNLKLP